MISYGKFLTNAHMVKRRKRLCIEWICQSLYLDRLHFLGIKMFSTSVWKRCSAQPNRSADSTGNNGGGGGGGGFKSIRLWSCYRWKVLIKWKWVKKETISLLHTHKENVFTSLTQTPERTNPQLQSESESEVWLKRVT